MEQTTSIEKAFEVLFHLHAQPAPAGVTAIGRALGLPKSSAHRLLASLARHGLVERDAAGHYRPGIALVALGLGVLEREPVVAAARPILESEAERLDETMFLTAARAGRIVVLDKVEGTGFLRAAPQVGSTIPIHATAVGKLYRAHAPQQISVEEVAFERFTRRTRTDADALDAEAALARARGWADNHEEWLPGLAVVAAPIFLGERMVAAIAVAAPTVRLDASNAAGVGAGIAAAAREVGRRLAGSAT